MSRRSARRNAREAGFALAETLVAAAIIAGMTALTFGIVAQDAHVQSAMRERREAVLVAQSVLAQAVAGAEQREVGETGDLHWQIARRPYDDGSRGSGTIALHQLGVRVSDRGSGRPLVALETLALPR